MPNEHLEFDMDSAWSVDLPGWEMCWPENQGSHQIQELQADLQDKPKPGQIVGKALWLLS